ncbi:L-rhamnose isomerase/sugar isomerase [Algoriphagus ratkowskyi]|uniref:Sugar isomerase n=1 Tax=Algoriphagus ratkowskyi TaxID=57028 RepID=A0A2W7R877_9BACT|nr:sugar isomerase [Algoriphagus ratkowskyi]PZX57063.1 L-rhamnose isomerase/sugar isomerase [Algoriphagus ratkowskyi]TXD79959.1 sugar isomerase [Algoriphagus ratkowskyi]
MKLTLDQINDHNNSQSAEHSINFDFLAESLDKKGNNVEELISKLQALQIAIPSWALGTGGTRFGRFSGGGEPATLVQKIQDVGILHALNQSSNAVSLHIPWDIPGDYQAIKESASEVGIGFDAVNSNTFQDQENQARSYKFGSLANSEAAVRELAVEHNKQVIEIGKKLGSKALTVWLADGSSFPGQHSLRKALENTHLSLQEIYKDVPEDWKLLIEYKPYEPHFYSTVIQDWGTSFLLANKLGKKAYTLVDLGHHLPNTNIEQIVATLMTEGKLGGFHFNDSKYGDDDLTVGSVKPYQLFLIFQELVKGFDETNNPPLSWMIDASHNLKDPMEDLIQSVLAIKLAYAQALLVDSKSLEAAQETHDVAGAQEILQDAYRTDLRPLLAEATRRSGGAIDPIKSFRSLKVRETLIEERGFKSIASGL